MTIIAIISQKGGAGKTTLALHLAAAAEADGKTAVVFDLDPQATASQWAAWRQDAPPAVIDCAPPRLAAKIAQAQESGASFIIIDTPPHADSAASAAVDVADLVLVPCRPSAFDLAAVKTTARLIEMRQKKAAVIFTAGPPNAPRTYDEAREVVASYGLECAGPTMPDRAAYRHATAGGQTVLELEPAGKAAADVRAIYKWACNHVSKRASKKVSK